MKIDYKQSLLDIGNPADRMQKLIEFINGEIEVMYIEKKIQGQVRKQMEKTQKEYYLNEQMKVIKKELGQGDGEVDEIEELKKSIEEAKMSDEAQDQGPPGGEAPRENAAHVRRVGSRAELHRVAPRRSLAQEDQGQPRHRARDGDPQRGPLRPR